MERGVRLDIAAFSKNLGLRMTQNRPRNIKKWPYSRYGCRQCLGPWVTSVFDSLRERALRALTGSSPLTSLTPSSYLKAKIGKHKESSPSNHTFTEDRFLPTPSPGKANGVGMARSRAGAGLEQSYVWYVWLIFWHSWAYFESLWSLDFLKILSYQAWPLVSSSGREISLKTELVYQF